MSNNVRRVVAVVDDDPRILESLQDLLESADYEVQVHSSGTSFLTSSIANIDCLITDVCMPVMDGFELRDRTKQLRPELPVFLISARRDLNEAGRVDGLAEGEFFPKPFYGPALLAAIDKVLHEKS